jgi:magnesium-transporting ATPase (P-type)
MSETLYNEVLRKAGYSFIPAILFFVVSLPEVYNTTDKLGQTNNRLDFSTYKDNCPTSTGKFLHTLVFFLLVWAVMRISRNNGRMPYKSNGLLAKYAFYSTLIFFLLSSSDAYNVSGSIISGLTNSAGCPNISGAFVHGLVYLVVLTLVMFFPKD